MKTVSTHPAYPQLASEKLSFELPLALPTLKDKAQSFVKLSNGAEACLFKARGSWNWGIEGVSETAD